MSDPDILKRLDGIENQLRFFADTYKHLHNIFIRGVHVNLEKSLLEPTLSTLNNRIYEFRLLFEELNKMVKEESIIGTLSFMAKRLHEMESTLSSLKEQGLKKKIHLDLTMDGYEMVRKKTTEKDMNTSEDSLDKLLTSIDEREKIVLTHRYGLLGNKIKTLDATGKIIGVSRERARAIQNKALRKCRMPSRRNLSEKIINKKLREDILGENNDKETEHDFFNDD